ncbi:MAG: hypothetical protein C5B59_16600 [Bacteroidetes bacterium]|nr:MAG: hypothetical protein C5B59_16600 [Bacteroidota bacterium]
MKRITIFTLLLIAASEIYAQPRYALVIGNGAYKYGQTLRNPTNDARNISERLSVCGFRVVEKENLSRSDFKKAIDSFAARIKGIHCEAVFFYSGHGIQVAGENFLIPVDASPTSEADVEDQCVRLQLLLDKMDEAGTRVSIIILDACRKDPFSKGWNKGPSENGLTNIGKAPSESFIAFATAPNTNAADGNGTNSPFSASLVKNISKPGQTIFEVFRQVSTDVRKQTGGQVPWNSYSLDLEFYFIKNKNFDLVSRPMEFLVTEDCILLIDRKNIGRFPGGKVFQVPNYDSGSHQIKVVSQNDSSIYLDTVYHYNPFNNESDNLMLIPLNNSIVSDTNLIAMLDLIKYSMVKVEGGSFTMGSKNGNTDEGPQHNVKLSSFLISKYEVTQRQYKAIMKVNPSSNNDCPDCPVENISWKEAEDFINELNHQRREHYRLPTEAEWEYAANGGAMTDHYLFSGARNLEKVAWYYGNSSGKTHPVGSRHVNELGLADLNGNVAEWCSDWYSSQFYHSSPLENPNGPNEGSSKVVRGGSWNDYEQSCRNSYRDQHPINFKDKTIGLRLASSIP